MKTLQFLDFEIDSYSKLFSITLSYLKIYPWWFKKIELVRVRKEFHHTMVLKKQNIF